MKRKLSHLQIIAVGYLLMIAVGTLLLSLPIASKTGESVGVFDALFTATSASCVTGLVVRDTALTWTLFGQVVILLMIQVGGLGFMTIASLFFRLLRLRVGLREREVMVEGLNFTHIGGIMRMTGRILIGTAIIEGIGALLLALRFVPQFGFWRGLWYSMFHSVSAFCNAGFDLMGSVSGAYSSFVVYCGDPLVVLTVSALIIIGGIGFLVWDDVRINLWHWRQYTLHTKIVLSSSAILTFGSALLFLFTERHVNAEMPAGEQVLAALFDAVTPRTAGMNTTDTAALSEGGHLLTILLMFIGGSPGSTAGGIKTTTLVVLIVQMVTSMRHSQTTSIFRREISSDILRKASTVFFCNLTLALGGTLLICAAQDLALSDVLFETFSAISTVGMTTGITRALVPFSRVVIIFLMFCGRVGSISFALALLEKRARPPVTYPHESITVG